jgi:hypothetical protein
MVFREKLPIQRIPSNSELPILPAFHPAAPNGREVFRGSLELFLHRVDRIIS